MPLCFCGRGTRGPQGGLMVTQSLAPCTSPSGPNPSLRPPPWDSPSMFEEGDHRPLGQTCGSDCRFLHDLRLSLPPSGVVSRVFPGTPVSTLGVLKQPSLLQSARVPGSRTRMPLLLGAVESSSACGGDSGLLDKNRNAASLPWAAVSATWSES